MGVRVWLCVWVRGCVGVGVGGLIEGPLPNCHSNFPGVPPTANCQLPPPRHPHRQLGSCGVPDGQGLPAAATAHTHRLHECESEE